jgi:hypothetical protein
LSSCFVIGQCVTANPVDKELMMAQRFKIHDNTLFHDNRSAIFLENNAQGSSSKCTHYINTRYFFVTDRIENGEVRVEYYNTDKMLADFFMKPLQGSLFARCRDLTMNISNNNIAAPAKIEVRIRRNENVLVAQLLLSILTFYLTGTVVEVKSL